MEVLIKRNSGEAAVVRITVPQTKLTAAEIQEIIDEKKKERRDDKSSNGNLSIDAKREKDVITPKKGSQDNSMLSHYSETVAELQEKLVEVDQDEKALAVLTSSKDLSYTCYVVNTYAERQHRHEFLHYINKAVSDYFHDNPNRQKEYQDRADSEAEATLNKFVSKTCGEYELPCLTYAVNAHDYE